MMSSCSDCFWLVSADVISGDSDADSLTMMSVFEVRGGRWLVPAYKMRSS